MFTFTQTTADFAVFDLETTFPPAHEIIEIAVVILDRVGLYEKDTWETFVKSDNVDERSFSVNHISNVSFFLLLNT